MKAPLLLVGPYRVVAPVASRGGEELVLAYEEGPGLVRQLVMLDVVRTGTPLFGLSAEELARKAAAGSALDHPHVLRTVRFFADKIGHVLVLEYLGGTTLGASIDAARPTGERWSDDAVLAMGAAACTAIAYAHTRGAAPGMGPIGHGAFDANAVHLGHDGSIKVGGFTRVAGTQAADRSAVGRMLWELLAGRARMSEDSSLSSVRPDLPPEVTALIEAACVGEPASVTLEQLGAWLEKATNLARAREDIARRVADRRPVQQVAAGRAHAGAPRWSERLRAAREALPTLATVAVLAGACFALGRVSHAPVAPKQVVFAAREAAVPDPAARGATAPPLSSAAVPPLGARSDERTGVAASETGGASADAGAAGRAAAALPSPATNDVGAAGAGAAAEPATGAALGWLTVHSPVRSASVYVHLLRSGGVDETIPVPCGKRLVSLGVANTKHPEPTWLAPAQMVRVPCGGVVETTIPAHGAKHRGR
jgi:hypothetical protein